MPRNPLRVGLIGSGLDAADGAGHRRGAGPVADPATAVPLSRPEFGWARKVERDSPTD